MSNHLSASSVARDATEDGDESLRLSLAQMRAGDVDAVAEFYDAVGALVFRLSLLITDDRAQAERATVLTFTRVWRSAQLVPQDPRSAREWLLRAACRIAHDLVRPGG